MLRRAPQMLLVVFVLLVARVDGAAASDCARTSTGLIPLTDLGSARYLGTFTGGLYPNGSNVIPAAHLAAGMTAANAVVPRRSDGTADSNGKIVLLSVGMSNTTMDFCGGLAVGSTCSLDSFMGQAATNPAVDHAALVLVDGAHGGEPASEWLDPAGDNYVRIASLLAAQGLSERQVQVVWVKQANPGPTVSLPAADADAYTLEQELGTIARTLKVRYPNLQQVFYSSRIYAGYASSVLNPEPYAYEGGFAVKWLVEAQIKQMAAPGGPVDPRAGDLSYDTIAPWVGWGPYLWADGLRPRSDGLTYACADFQVDGTHPSEEGIRMVAGMLLEFFLGSPVTQSWFRADGTTGTPSLDQSVLGRKLVLIDGYAVGKAKAVFVSRDIRPGAIQSGSGSGDPADLSGNVKICPTATPTNTAFYSLASPWLVNTPAIARYVNGAAAPGAPGVRVVKAKRGRLLAVVAKNLGDGDAASGDDDANDLDLNAPPGTCTVAVGDGINVEVTIVDAATATTHRMCAEFVVDAASSIAAGNGCKVVSRTSLAGTCGLCSIGAPTTSP